MNPKNSLRVTGYEHNVKYFFNEFILIFSTEFLSDPRRFLTAFSGHHFWSGGGFSRTINLNFTAVIFPQINLFLTML